MSKILVIEDSIEIVDLFKRFLDNHELTFAYNGEQAIDERCNKKFDLIFMDNDLGEGLTGEDIAWLQADSINNFTLTIVHSANIVASPKIVATIKEFNGNAVWIMKGTTEFFNKLNEINNYNDKIDIILNEDANDIKNEQNKSRGEED